MTEKGHRLVLRFPHMKSTISSPVANSNFNNVQLRYPQNTKLRYHSSHPPFSRIPKNLLDLKNDNTIYKKSSPNVKSDVITGNKDSLMHHHVLTIPLSSSRTSINEDKDHVFISLILFDANQASRGRERDHQNMVTCRGIFVASDSVRFDVKN